MLQTTMPAHPVYLSTFIGRQAELELGRRLLEDSRLVTITGPGGAGKTRLAAELSKAALLAFSDLSACSDGDGVQMAVAASLGAAADPGPGGRERILHELRGGGGILVVDNCEQVVDAAADLVEVLLRRGPSSLRVLATSQEPLAVPGEKLLRLGSLPEAEAQQLFKERVREGSPAFELIGLEEQVEVICRRLDGIPLALELAAARARNLPLADLLAGLEDRFQLLVGTSRRAPTRQQTLEATVAWSYGLLSEVERALFNRIAVLSGPFGTPVAVVAGAGDHVAAGSVPLLLSRLGERSLLEVVDGGRAFRMPETLRAYGRARLVEAGEAIDVTLRAAAHLEKSGAFRTGLALAEEALALLADDDERRPTALELIAGQAERVGCYAACARALEELRERPEVRTTPERLAEVEMRLSSAISLATGDLASAADSAARALQLYRKLEDQPAALQAETELAWLVGLGGDPTGQLERARRVVGEARVLAFEGDAHLHALGCAGDGAAFTGRFVEARDFLEEGLRIARHRQDAYQVGWFTGSLAQLVLFTEGPRPALRLLSETRPLVEQHLDPVFIESVMACHLLSGAPERALTAVTAEQDSVLAFGIRGAFILSMGAAAAADLGQAAVATEMLAAADHLFGGIEIFYQSRARGWMAGRVAWALGEPAAAARLMLGAANVLEEIGMSPVAALALRDAADAAWDAGLANEEEAALMRLQSLGMRLGGKVFPALMASGTVHGTQALARLGLLELRARSLEREGRTAEAAAAYEELGFLQRMDRTMSRLAVAGKAPGSAAARRLARIVVFDGFPAAELERLAAASTRLSYGSGEAIFARGASADAVFAIESGEVRLVVPEIAGDRRLGEAFAGELIGERALLEGEHHAATAKAVVPSIVIRLPVSALLEELRQRPRLVERSVALLQQRFRREAAVTGEPERPDVAAQLLGSVQRLAATEGRLTPAFELLPVYQDGGGIWLLRPREKPSWMVDADPGRAPEQVVAAALEAVGCAAEVVHSTSWRYQDGRLVLTYLAVLAAGAPPPGFVTLHVERAELARGSAKAAPTTILVTQVVEHAFRHLSWLSRDDAVIRDSVSPAWLEIVADYQPEPFRAL
jgi:predicted ATPase/CRP-like cAMP-binding protein